MANISDAYGINYQQDSINSKNAGNVEMLANNIANGMYQFKLHDTSDLWNVNNKMKNNVISNLINKIQFVNNNLSVNHINQNTNKINMVPVLITGTPIEYFYIVDKSKARVFMIYITPTEVNCY